MSVQSPFQDEINFKRLYEVYYAPFCIYAKRFIEDLSVREDIVSDVFLLLWKRKDEIEFREETILAYLKSSVRNSCLNHIKHHEIEANYISKLKDQFYVDEQSPDRIYNAEELYELLRHHISKLPADYKEVFIKYFHEGKTHAEIAKELNISVKTVDRHKRKVIEMLREELKDFIAPDQLSMVLLVLLIFRV